MQKRLLRQAKPRKKKKEIKLTVKFVFEAFSDNENEAKADLKAFRNWMRDVFPQWNETILQHFLTQTHLQQDSTGKKYLLAANIDKILLDESSIKDERKWVDNELHTKYESAEESIKRQEEELFKFKHNSSSTISQPIEQTTNNMKSLSMKAGD